MNKITHTQTFCAMVDMCGESEKGLYYGDVNIWG